MLNCLRPHKILVIDDENSILKLLSGVLARKGHNVDTACGGEEGVKKIQSNSYDVVITDFKMPGVSGREILNEARRIKGDTLPVIGMSGTPWLLGEAQFDAVLAKPFSQEKLFEAIQTVMDSPPVNIL
ncbi:MAG: response regulator [Desulfobacter sp.]